MKRRPEKPRKKNKTGKILLTILALVILIPVAYLLYVILSYHRIPQDQILTPNNEALSADAGTIPVGESLSAVTCNIGFGAYVQDYTFFMDGGTESRARSKDICASTVLSMAEEIKKLDADLILFQEVDIDSTRSHHLDQRTILTGRLDSYATVFAQNYDSAYLFYPVMEPHGASKSGLFTLSRYAITSSLRRSLPVSEKLTEKLVDLDRCYSITRIPTENGKELCLFNVHLTAYGSSEELTRKQQEMLYADLKTEVEKGNYVICGGDFNHDLPGDSVTYFNDSVEPKGWTQPLLTDLIPEGIEVVLETTEGRVASCRDNDIPYTPGVSFTVTVDGFMVSDNVTVVSLETVDLAFRYSDHNPVSLTFVLEP